MFLRPNFQPQDEIKTPNTWCQLLGRGSDRSGWINKHDLNNRRKNLNQIYYV